MQALCDAFFAHYGEVVPPEHISPERMPDLPGFAETFLPANAAGSGTSAMLPPSATCWRRSVSPGAGSSFHFDVEKGVIGRAPES